MSQYMQNAHKFTKLCKYSKIEGIIILVILRNEVMQLVIRAEVAS